MVDMADGADVDVGLLPLELSTRGPNGELRRGPSCEEGGGGGLQRPS